MFHTRRKLQLSCAVLWVLSLTACGGGVTPQPAAAIQPTSAPQPTEATAATTETPAKAEPVVLKIGWTGKPDSLNPAAAFLSEAYSIFDLTYGTLTR